MSNPRYWWWENVKRAIRAYPSLCAKKADRQAMPVTRQGNGAGRGASSARKTEEYALRGLSPEEERIIDAVAKAWQLTEAMPDGNKRLELLRAYYWKGERLLNAALKIPIDESTAKRWNGVFVRLVACGLGFHISDDGHTGKRRR